MTQLCLICRQEYRGAMWEGLVGSLQEQGISFHGPYQEGTGELEGAM